MKQLVQAVHNFDEHLRVSATPANGQVSVAVVLPPEPPPVATPAQTPPSRIRVGGNIQSTKVIVQPKPVYPAEAKAARVQGVVSLHATIGKDGAVQNLDVISGDPLLVPAAIGAVRQWVYQPTNLNGQPVEVETQIDVNFTLAQ
jgi:protein TonB